MGGFGSGRSAGLGRDTVESTRSIDVNRLHREGCLRPGWCGGWQRTRDGEKVATINLRAEEDRLRFSYRVSSPGSRRLISPRNSLARSASFTLLLMVSSPIFPATEQACRCPCGSTRQGRCLRTGHRRPGKKVGKPNDRGSCDRGWPRTGLCRMANTLTFRNNIPL